MKYTKEYLLSHHWMLHHDEDMKPNKIKIWRQVAPGVEVVLHPMQEPLLGAAVILAWSNPAWIDPGRDLCMEKWVSPLELFATWAGIDQQTCAPILQSARDSMECPVRQEAEKTRQHLVEMGVLPADGVQLKVKRLHPDAIMPKYQSAGAACFDLHALITAVPGFEHDGRSQIMGDSMTLRTGLAFEIPQGWVMLIYSRSGDGFNWGIRLANCVGVIDSDYRGEVQVKLARDVYQGARRVIKHGDRIAQAMLVQLPQVDLVEVSELSVTERGEAGFGSTGA